MAAELATPVLPGLQPARDTGNAPGLPVMFPVYENGMTTREEAGAAELLLHIDNRSLAPPRSGRGKGGFTG
jgi:hypothetical protein